MNGTSRTSRKKKSKQQRRNGNCVNTGQSVTSTLSKKQQAIFNAPVKLGDEVLVTIHGIGSSGEGVGRVDEFTVFVPFALPGETVKISINMVKKTYATGRLLELSLWLLIVSIRAVISMAFVVDVSCNTLPMKASFH